MILGLRSIRHRIIALSLILAGMLLGASLYTEGRVKAAARHYQEAVTRQQAFVTGLDKLKNIIYLMGTGVYRYAVLQDDSARASVESLTQVMLHRSQALSNSAFARNDTDMRNRLDALDAVLRQTDRQVRRLLNIIGTLHLRFPASSIITGKLYPENLAFGTALEDAVLDARLDSDKPSGRRRLQLLSNIRYLWSQQISTVRLYIANRSGVFGMPESGMQQHLHNRDNYMEEIHRELRALQRNEGRNGGGPVLGDALQRMNTAYADYQRDFRGVISVYESNGWRGDVKVLRNTIQPLFGRVRIAISQVDARVGTITSKGMLDSLQLAETLNDFLWRIMIVAAVLMLLGYLAYESTIRRPIDQVIAALAALGKGEAYTPLFKARAQETDMLLHAFRDMQNQVHARETRLTSILDNASEGIITINDKGIIETFNNAAESLFRYSADEVLGKSVNMLMPHPTRNEHDSYIRRYRETGEQRIIGNEMNVNALRKDGTVFPMSIKVGEIQLEGRLYFTAIVSDISERKALLDHLRHLAEHDSLTGLYNRQYFTDELERVVQRSMRQGGLDCALLYIDLDNFKYVNDTLGHLAGDRVLIEVSTLITSRTRRSDLVARLGGDEFALLLYDVDARQALDAGDAYRQALAEYQFRHDGKVIDVGCSVGVALFDDSVDSREDLMARADISCHMAKRAGRNCVHVYQADDRARMDTMFADMGWTRTIKQAIEEDHFVFALQPIVSIPQRVVEKYEVLLRMQGEHGELIMPSGFIPSAERFGLVVEVDRWVVGRAIAMLADGAFGDEAKLAINLSAMAIGDQEILRLITEGVQRHGIEPHRLTFEITETIAVADLGAASVFLTQLHSLGCLTALDDFGVGYSSFAYLKDLPVDCVKIDGSFVRDMATDPVQMAMVKSMNEIAHAMGKRTVAEYVESERVLELLHAIGVDFAQGYYTGRPQLVDGADLP